MTTHLYLVRRFGIIGAIPLCTLYAFTVWTGTNLPLLLPYILLILRDDKANIERYKDKYIPLNLWDAERNTKCSDRYAQFRIMK
jgi:hypothetical protein